MTAKVVIVINEQHTLMPDQVRSLNEKFGEGLWERLDVPADGWSAAQQIAAVANAGDATLVFASPLPLMIQRAMCRVHGETFVFHNDERAKKEIPQGEGKPPKIIFTVAPTGWRIL